MKKPITKPEGGCEMQRDSLKAKPLRLLSLDGGSVRGLSSLLILQQLLQGVAMPPPKPCEVFDLIGGTSTGGLIAIMLGRLRMGIGECIDVYSELADLVFVPKRHKLDVISRTKDFLKLREKFDSKKLEEIMKKFIVGAKEQADAKLKEDFPQCRIFVCATRGENRDTAILRNYESTTKVREVDCMIWEAARATSAASTFFDSIKIGQYGEEYLEGGTGYNNPVEKVVEEARSLWEDADKNIACIISIGTGQQSSQEFGGNLKKVLKTLTDIATETERTAEKFEWMYKDVFISERPAWDSEQLRRYFRFNVPNGLHDIGLHESKKKNEIAAMTKTYLGSASISDAVTSCAHIMRLWKNEHVKIVPGWTNSHLKIAFPPKSLHNPNVTWRCLESFRRCSSWDVAEHLEDVCDPEGTTFSWVKTHPCFTKATAPSFSGVLHITGKPECGKSVLAKYIYTKLESTSSLRSDHPKPTILFFAFNDRIEGRRTAENMLGASILQLLDRSSVPWSMYENFVQWEAGQSNHKITRQWSLQELLSTFKVFLTSDVLSAQGNGVICIIDGLDECVSGTGRTKLLGAFRNIIAHSQTMFQPVKLIITCRSYAEIGFASLDPILLDLNAEDAVDEDISLYITYRVDELIRQRPAFASFRNQIKSKLLERADKMYLLIELLLSTMHQMSLSSPHAITKMLEALPTTLVELYNRIWEKIGYSERDQAKLLLAWLACLFRPLTLEELAVATAYFEFNQAIISGVEAADYELYSNQFSREEAISMHKPIGMREDLHLLFGPLVVIKDLSSNKDLHSDTTALVQLCHLSVRDWILQRQDLFNVGQAHFQLAFICARYQDLTLAGDQDTYSIRTGESAVTIWNRETRTYGAFNLYAHGHWQGHRDAAEKLLPGAYEQLRLRRQGQRPYNRDVYGKSTEL